jgi:NAD(P)-dependent dehydrogenase (short-subunit alcohol dehydrogenase family)
MDTQLAGKTALVTGASRGIGLAIVTTLLEEGMRVVAGSRTVPPELAASGAIAVQVDLGTAQGPVQLVERALTELTEIDLLVNNVGGGDSDGGQTGGFATFDDQQWHQMFELNFFSAVRATRAALPSLLRRKGSIVNISSNAARMPHAGPMPYTTAKAALTAFGKALTEEVSPLGVRVNTISPGPTDTARSSRVRWACHTHNSWRNCQQGWASPPADSWSPPRSPPWSDTWPHRCPAASPAQTTSSTAARSKPPDRRRDVANG